MKWFSYFILIACSSGCQAAKSNLDTTALPACIQQFIENGKKENLFGSVEEFLFQDKLVYAFGPPPNVRDGTTLIKSADCKDMCHIGGFAGPRNSNCNGDNFFEKAVLKRKIWEADK